MKSKLSKSLLLALIAALLPQLASAHDFEVDGIYYLINGNEATVTYRGSSYNEYSNEYTGVVNLPSLVTYNDTSYSVTSIGSSAFSECTGLTSVTIPNSVTTIGGSAFERCTGLTLVTIPNSVTSIGGAAFAFCSGLTSVDIPNSVTEIGDGFFIGCTGLTSVTIPNSVTSIGNMSFYKCSGLSSVTIGNSVTSIGGSAFEDCTGLTSVTIGNSVTSIGRNAFSDCSGLTSVAIPNSVTMIGVKAFSGCSGLTSVTIPNSVTMIGVEAFSGCSGLTSVTIGNSVTSIGEYAFKLCTSLKNLTIEDGEETSPPTSMGVFSDCPLETLYLGRYIGDYFNNNSSLISVTIGNSVTSIGWGAFDSCSSLTSVIIGNSVTTIGDNAFSDCSSLTSVTIGNSVTTIGFRAFYRCSSLTSATIPNSVTSIGEAAFYRCSGLTSVIIGNLVTSIGKLAFSNCTGLTSVTIPNSVTSIGNMAFYKCSGLSSVTIGNSVTSIGDEAFISCSSLRSIISEIVDPSLVNMGNDVFDYAPDYCKLFVPHGTSSVYKQTDQWKDFSRIIEDAIVVDGLVYNKTEDGVSLSAVPYYYSGDIVIPNSIISDGNTYFVNSIGDFAFFYCSGLTSIIIPNSVTSIGLYAFGNCESLTSVTIPNSVTKISEGAFASCIGLTSLTIPNTVTLISANAFSDCSGLTSITIPNSVKEIGRSAFLGCTGLTSITIPNSVWNIDEYAFASCSGLISVAIPASTWISNTAFDECSNLNSLTVTGNGYYGKQILINQLKTINIGSGITSLGDCGFTPDVVNCYAETPPTCSSGTFANYDGELHVPSASAVAYFAAPYWQNFDNLNNDIMEKVTISQTEANIQQWGTIVLSATTTPNSGNVKWTSSNSTVATVDDDGVVNAICEGEGECYIFATLESNPAVYASCHVIVSYPDISISLNYNEIDMKFGEGTTLVATITPNNTGLIPTWTSSNTNVATVENGLVTAVGEGECYITAAALDKTATCHVIVDEVSISLNYSEIEMRFSEDTTLIATIDPDNVSLIPTWSSSNTSVATVENGVVTAISEGECYITATVLDKTASCHVIVNGNVVITLSKDYAILGANQLLTIYPSCYPDVPVELVATSSDPSVAMVRVINRSKAPNQQLLSFEKAGMALTFVQNMAMLAPADGFAPALVGEKAIMIVGVQNGTATITVTTSDGKAEPALLELRVVDVDGDQVITSSDITAIYNYLLTGDDTFAVTSDVNGDGYITAADVTAIYDILLGN